MEVGFVILTFDIRLEKAVNDGLSVRDREKELYLRIISLTLKISTTLFRIFQSVKAKIFFCRILTKILKVKRYHRHRKLLSFLWGLFVPNRDLLEVMRVLFWEEPQLAI